MAKPMPKRDQRCVAKGRSEPMKNTRTFRVKFVRADGTVDVKAFKAGDPGEALASCLTDHPGSKLIGAEARGHFGTFEGRIVYDPPPKQRPPVKEPRPARKPNKDERVGEFQFYDSARSQRPIGFWQSGAGSKATAPLGVVGKKRHVHKSGMKHRSKMSVP